MWNSGRLDYNELSNIRPRVVKGEYFAKGTEKCKILGNLLDKQLENLEDHGCPKVEYLVDEEMWLCSSYPFRHKTTLHCAECTAKLFGIWIMHHLKLISLCCEMFVSIYEPKSSKFLQSFFEIHYLDIERITQMTDKIIFEDNNEERKSWACLGQTCSRSLIVFLSQLSVILLTIFECFGEFIFQKLVTNPLFGWDFCVVQRDTFYPHQDYEQVHFYKNSYLYIIGRALQYGKVTTYSQLAQKRNVSTKF